MMNDTITLNLREDGAAREAMRYYSKLIEDDDPTRARGIRRKVGLCSPVEEVIRTGRKPSDPTVAEIKEQKAAIRAGWPGKLADPVQEESSE